MNPGGSSRGVELDALTVVPIRGCTAGSSTLTSVVPANSPWITPKAAPSRQPARPRTTNAA